MGGYSEVGDPSSMTQIKGKVGARELTWLSSPRGESGSSHVSVEGKTLEVRWRKDADGIWIELPSGVHGFDLEGGLSDDGKMLYRVAERCSDNYWENVGFLRAGEENAALSDGAKKRGVRVRAQMPGKIIRVSVKVGAEVVKDQSLAVMEAMKMENEIRAPQAGVVGRIAVSEGQTVETGADLIVIESVGA